MLLGFNPTMVDSYVFFFNFRCGSGLRLYEGADLDHALDGGCLVFILWFSWWFSLSRAASACAVCQELSSLFRQFNLIWFTWFYMMFHWLSKGASIKTNNHFIFLAHLSL